MFDRVIKNSVYCLLFIATTAWSLPDPTKPTSYRAATAVAQSLTLESILISDERKLAIINGVVVTEGENVGSVKVVNISQSGVKVNSDGKALFLKLDNASIRQEK